MNYRDMLLADYFDEGYDYLLDESDATDAADAAGYFPGTPQYRQFVKEYNDKLIAADDRTGPKYDPKTGRRIPQVNPVAAAMDKDLAPARKAQRESEKREEQVQQIVKEKKAGAAKQGKKDAVKKFMTKRNAGIAGGAAVGLAGGAAATASAIKLAQAKKDLKAKKITKEQYKALKKKLVGGIVAGGAGAAIGTTGAIVSAKKLKEECDMAYIASYMDTIDTLNEVYNSLDSSYDYYDEDYYDEDYDYFY